MSNARTDNDTHGIARLMCVAKLRDTICVLHDFTKKSQQTPKTYINLAKTRYREATDG
jgi:phage-related protein